MDFFKTASRFLHLRCTHCPSIKTISAEEVVRLRKKRERWEVFKKQGVAQWAMKAHLGASIMFGDTMICDAQRQVNLLESDQK